MSYDSFLLFYLLVITSVTVITYVEMTNCEAEILLGI
jgi:hypothetical protein